MFNPFKHQKAAAGDRAPRPLLADSGEDSLIADETPRKPLSDNLHQAASQLASDPTLTQDQRRQKLWQQVQANPPSMPPQRLLRWGDDPARRDAAMDGLMRLATDPGRADQNPDQITHLWANGMAGNPGDYERNNPPPPPRSFGQVVGYQTDPYGQQRQFPLADGFRADWHDFSATIGERTARPARWLGYDNVANRLEADAARDRAAIDPLRDQYKYDPNASLAFNAGYYGREAATAANRVRNFGKLYRWLRGK